MSKIRTILVVFVLAVLLTVPADAQVGGPRLQVGGVQCNASVLNFTAGTCSPPTLTVTAGGGGGGVTSLTAGGGVTVSAATGAVALGSSCGGDLAGTVASATVGGLQGRAVSNAAPSIGQVLGWTSSVLWEPVSIVNSLIAGTGITISGSTGTVTISASGVTLSGDVTGASSATTVSKIQGTTINVGGLAVDKFLGSSDGTTIGIVNGVTNLTATSPVSVTAPNGPVTVSLSAGSYAQYTAFTGSAATAISGGATGFLVSPGIAAAAGSDVALIVATENFTSIVRELVIRADTAPGIGQSITVTLRKKNIGGAWADTAATVTIVNNNIQNNATVAISLFGGELLGFKAVQSAGSSAAGITVTGLITAN